MKFVLIIFYIFLVSLFSSANSWQFDRKTAVPSKLSILPTTSQLFIFNASSFSQQKDSLPSKEILFQSLATYYEKKTAAELAEFQENTKGEWLKYLPSVGISYTFYNKPRPTASLSTSTLYNAKKSKQARAAKRKAIIQTNALAHQQDQISVQQLLNQYQLEEEALIFQETIFKIDETLFELEEAKYQALEIAPSEFLKIKRAYLVKVFDLKERWKKLQLLGIEIMVMAKEWNGSIK